MTHSKRLKSMWTLVILSQFLVLQMSLDVGQYRVDQYGILGTKFEGPMRERLDQAINGTL